MLIHSIYFDLGSDVAKPEDIQAALAEINKNPGKLLILGSACDTPIWKPETKAKFPTNLALSCARTLNVANALLGLGVAESLITNGTFRGATAGEDKTKNRVVEIHVLP